MIWLPRKKELVLPGRQRGFFALPAGLGVVQPERDPYWANVSALLHLNGANATTTLTDQTGKTWTAQSGAQISSAQSVFGGASLLLNGTSDYASTPSVSAFQVTSQNWTAEARIRLTALNAQNTICSKRATSGAHEHTFQVDSNNKLRANIFTGSVNVAQGVTSLTTGQWYAVAAVRSGNTLYVFLDGVLDASGSISGSASTNTATMNIGQDPAAAGRFFAGYIDEFRFTLGVARYTSNYTPRAIPFPNM